MSESDFQRVVREGVGAENPAPKQQATAAEWTEPLMQFFAFGHLPEHLQKVSLPFAALASTIVTTLPRNPERTVALRFLLQAKDCAVRAVLYK